MCSARHNRLKARGRAARLCVCACTGMLLLMASCSRGGAGEAAGGPAATLPPGLIGNPQQPAGSVALRLTQTAPQGPGDRLTAQVEASQASLLYQLSCRLAYDPLAVKPVLAERGGLVDSRAIFFAPLAAAPGYVPLAFTYHPGEAIPAPGGSVARIEFEVLDASREPGLHLLADPAYLLARTALNQPLRVELGVAR